MYCENMLNPNDLFNKQIKKAQSGHDPFIKRVTRHDTLNKRVKFNTLTLLSAKQPVYNLLTQINLLLIKKKTIY